MIPALQMRLYHGIVTSFLWAGGRIHVQRVRVKDRNRVKRVRSRTRRRLRLHHLITSTPLSPTEIVYRPRTKTDSIRRPDTHYPGFQVVAVFLIRALSIPPKSRLRLRSPTSNIGECETCGHFWGDYRLSWRVCLGHIIAGRISDERKIVVRRGYNRSSIRLCLGGHRKTRMNVLGNRSVTH